MGCEKQNPSLSEYVYEADPNVSNVLKFNIQVGSPGMGLASNHAGFEIRK